MNVASLELCKKLYELSDRQWTVDDIDQDTWYTDNYDDRICPMYTLGYLARKLPQSIEDENTAGWMLKLEHPSHGWNAYYYVGSQGGIADTPEDAVTKLSIELWKQGVLK